MEGGPVASQRARTALRRAQEGGVYAQSAARHRPGERHAEADAEGESLDDAPRQLAERNAAQDAGQGRVGHERQGGGAHAQHVQPGGKPVARSQERQEAEG